MNLNNLKPAWDQYKATNGLSDIPEADILSAIEQANSRTASTLTGRIVQNAFAYTLLIFALHGCAI